MKSQDSYRWFLLALMIMTLGSHQLVRLLYLSAFSVLFLHPPPLRLHVSLFLTSSPFSFSPFASSSTSLSSSSVSSFYLSLANTSPPSGVVVDRIRNMFQ